MILVRVLCLAVFLCGGASSLVFGQHVDAFKTAPPPCFGIFLANNADSVEKTVRALILGLTIACASSIAPRTAAVRAGEAGHPIHPNRILFIGDSFTGIDGGIGSHIAALAA